MENNLSFGNFMGGKRRKYADPTHAWATEIGCASLLESIEDSMAIDLTGEDPEPVRTTEASRSNPALPNGNLKSFMYRPEEMQGTPSNKPEPPEGGWKRKTTASVKNHYVPAKRAASPSIFVEPGPIQSIEQDFAANVLPSTGLLPNGTTPSEVGDPKALFEAAGIPSVSLATHQQSAFLTEADRKAEEARLKKNEASRIWRQKQKQKDPEGWQKRCRDASLRMKAKKKAKLEGEEPALPPQSIPPQVFTRRPSDGPELANDLTTGHFKNTEVLLEPTIGNTEALPKHTESLNGPDKTQRPATALPSRGLQVYAPRVAHGTALRGYKVTNTAQNRSERLINQTALFLNTLSATIPEVSRAQFLEALSLEIPIKKVADTAVAGGSLADLITAQKAQAQAVTEVINSELDEDEILCDSPDDDEHDPDFDWEYFVILETRVPEASRLTESNMYQDVLPTKQYGRYHSTSEANSQVFARVHETFFRKYRSCYDHVPRKEDVTVISHIQPNGLHTCSCAYGKILVEGHVKRRPGRKKRLPGSVTANSDGLPCWHVYASREYSNTTKSQSERPRQAPTLVCACTSRESANRAAGWQWIQEMQPLWGGEEHMEGFMGLEEYVWEYVDGLEQEMDDDRGGGEVAGEHSVFVREYRLSEEEGKGMDCEGQETWGEKAEDLRLEMVKVWVEKVEVLGPEN